MQKRTIRAAFGIRPERNLAISESHNYATIKAVLITIVVTDFYGDSVSSRRVFSIG
jgi:hypothetical protein